MAHALNTITTTRAHTSTMASTLRVGGVPEHFNAPFHLAKKDKSYGAVNVEFTEFPGGTGAMGQALAKNEADVCIMLTEGAVCQIANGAKQRIVGTYVESPLRWGVHKKAGRKVPDSPVFGISRNGSGSHLMAFVQADKLGIDPDKIKFEVVGSLAGAVEAMQKETIDLFLWEKFTTKHMCDRGEWECVDVVPTPWPCFSFVATEEAIKTKSKALRKLIDVTSLYCRGFKKNENNSTVEYVSKNHAMSRKDAATWLDETEWLCASEVSESSLEDVVKYLKKLKLCPHIEQQKIVTDAVTVRKNMPEDMYAWRVTALKNWLADQEKQLGRKLTMEDLNKAGHLDQFHYHALAANDEMINILQLGPHDKVLDVGSGIGGPARYISWKSGAEIVGIEIQQDLVTASTEVAKTVGLDRVSFHCKDACRMTEENVYTAWYSMLVVLHIPKEPRMEMFRRLWTALKDDGAFLIEDFVQVSPFTDKDMFDLDRVVGSPYVPGEKEYRDSLEAAGYVDINFEDMTASWKTWVEGRFQNFKKNYENHKKLNGPAIAEKQLAFYTAVNGMFQSGRLGGARITGRKPSSGEKRLRKGRLMVHPASGSRFVSDLEASMQKMMPKWMAAGPDAHDSLQFHFFHKEYFFVLRLFGTGSVQRAWVWMARRANKWKPEQLYDNVKGESIKQTLGSVWLDVTSGNMSIKESPQGVTLKWGNELTVTAMNRTEKRWGVPGQADQVIHRPDLVATIVYQKTTLKCTGYSKRYYGPNYGPRWAYHFIQGHLPAGDDATFSALWTADARFGDNKYNYFKIVENGKFKEAKADTCYHQGYIGRCVMDGQRQLARVTPLGEHRTILTSEKMDSEMIETVCELCYDDGVSVRTGFGFYERCMGTIR